MTKPLAIEGFVDTESVERTDDGRESRKELQRLEDENRSLRRELEDVAADKERATRTIKNLQRLLNPIYQGMRALFGEIELAVGEETFAPNPASPTASPQNNADPRWESYKRRFPGKPAAIIDALLVHDTMGITALSNFIGSHKNTTWAACSKLKAAGALDNSGGKWSLKR
jgi:hypothetical protein